MFSHQHVLVIGLARSGYAAIEILKKMNAQVTLNTYEKLGDSDLERLETLGVEVVDGGHPLSILDTPFDFVVKNPGVPIHLPLIERIQELNIEILTEIELGYQICPHLEYLAITGTNGKTTTTTLVYELMKKQSKPVYLAGNIGYPLCEVLLSNQLFTKEAIIVIEIAGFQLQNIKTFKPKIGAILNLAPDHLDYFKDVEEYYQSKVRIALNMNFDDYLIYNIDDSVIETHLRKDKTHLISVSLKQRADVWLKEDVIMFGNQPIITIEDIKIKGLHNVMNVMFAISFAKKMDISNEMIKEVIHLFIGVEHRIEYVNTIEGVEYYNDSKATNIESVEVALKAFKQPMYVLLGGKDKGLDFTPLFKLDTYVKEWILFGQAIQTLAPVFKNSKTFKTMEEAIDYAKKQAQSGDVVLLSPGCASYDAFKNYEERGRSFKTYVNHLSGR